jgi:nucleotide-binding universal stress UspA family protein
MSLFFRETEIHYRITNFYGTMKKEGRPTAMKILCAVGMQGGVELVRRVHEVVGTEHELVLLHVIDSGPRRALDEILHRPGRRPPPSPPPPPPGQAAGRDPAIDAAEQAAGEAALAEARQDAERAGFAARSELRKGRPEQVIVMLAGALGCPLIAIQAGAGSQGRPAIGPESMGHVARFVLDHAPCDVLLLREG